MSDVLPLLSPLRFAPTYQVLVWGGRKMAAYRQDLPEGPVGESWDLADQDRGMSVVQEGPWKGTTLRDLTRARGKELVGDDFPGGSFPLLVKLIDAAARLSVQVHPDDQLAQAMNLGSNGKTECWLMIGDGGELYQGTKPHVDRAAFEAALAQGRVEETLNRFETHDGDFFFLQARTVHALGNNCLLYEVQQSSDITFRVWDWGRVGLDGKPRPLHVKESLETIDFSRTGFGAVRAEVGPHPAGGLVRTLADCAFFTVEERLLVEGEVTTHPPNGKKVCSLVTCLGGAGELRTQGGAVALSPMQTVLVPASAGGWRAQASTAGLKLMHAQPKFAGNSR
ncbi:MAG: type I phosphomannose isomerase catalytic subunit [Deltaproteobacteria bacterium]|nr:type I phosphomannose isomerase catalytic subunit [Deltaproteobacteria bacterium]